MTSTDCTTCTDYVETAYADLLTALTANGTPGTVEDRAGGVTVIRVNLPDGTHVAISDANGNLYATAGDRTDWHEGWLVQQYDSEDGDPIRSYITVEQLLIDVLIDECHARGILPGGVDEVVSATVEPEDAPTAIAEQVARLRAGEGPYAGLGDDVRERIAREVEVEHGVVPAGPVRYLAVTFTVLHPGVHTTPEAIVEAVRTALHNTGAIAADASWTPDRDTIADAYCAPYDEVQVIDLNDKAW